ncbi:XK-related protein 8 [Coturnix japonica]|uniref:XK-related protein n=1 Tax=Coturnix japonica TaxID=93934 RepID=A0A8C2TVT8_COTJA|nr:XK-related protein 8 [Coturnix japonica]
MFGGSSRAALRCMGGGACCSDGGAQSRAVGRRCGAGRFRAGRGAPGMAARDPARFGPWQFLLLAVGAAAAAWDVGADVWVAVGYARGGQPGCAALGLGLWAACSAARQACSWLWFRSDPPQLRPELPRRLLAAMHVLQLGFFYRCCRALRLGWRLCRTEPTGEERSHMAFVLHDISMLRLFETFLENAPQLAVLLYSVLRTNKAEPAQGMGICTAFLCVTWSLLDYHQSLRSFLQDKYEMGWGSSVIYFLWNLFLLCPRILALALFALLLPYGVAVHFLLVWLAMFIWVSLQGTDFMESPGPEQLYRAMVAVILYFSWFNVAPGRTLQRSIIYHSFILVDIALLSLAWLWGCPIEEQHPHLKPALWAALSCYVLGLLLRVTYYWWLHPNVRAQPPSGDEVDAHGRADGAVQFRSISEPCEPRGVSQPDLVNSRLRCLARTHFPLAALAEPRLLNGAAAV